MREFQARWRVRPMLYSKPVVVLLIIATLFLMRSTWGVYKKERESAANALTATKELERLKNRQQVLEREIERLSTDVGIEEEIRSTYSVAKPGERLIVIVGTTSEVAATSTAVTHEGWWNRFTHIFK